MASLTCQCGQTTVSLLATKPVFGLECFCCDCLQRADFFCKQCGRQAGEIENDVMDQKKPLFINYVSGKAKVTGGALRFSRVREGSATISGSSKCCNSLLLIDHPNYQSKLIAIYPEFSNPSANFELPSIAGRCWIKDWPEEKFNAYATAHPIEGGSFWRDHAAEKLVSTGPFVPLMDDSKVEAVKQMEVAAEEFKTFKELMGEDCVVEVLGLEEGENSAKKMAGK